MTPVPRETVGGNLGPSGEILMGGQKKDLVVAISGHLARFPGYRLEALLVEVDGGTGQACVHPLIRKGGRIYACGGDGLLYLFEAEWSGWRRDRLSVQVAWDRNHPYEFRKYNEVPWKYFHFLDSRNWQAEELAARTSVRPDERNVLCLLLRCESLDEMQLNVWRYLDDEMKKFLHTGLKRAAGMEI